MGCVSRRIITAAIAALLMLGVAPAARAQQAQHKLVFSVASPAIYYLPHYIAEAAGFYKQENIELEKVFMASGSRMVAGMMGGSIDLMPMNFALIVSANEKGGELISVASVYDIFGHALVLSNDAMKKVGITKEMSTDEKVRRLKGLKIAITSAGSGSDQLVRTLFIARGMDPDKQVQLMPLGQGDSMLAAFEKGLVDGFSFSAPYGQIAEQKGIGQTIIDPLNYEAPELQGGNYLVLATTRSVLAKNRPALEAAVRAMTKAMKLARDNPEEVRRLTRPYFPGMDEAVFNAMFDKGVRGVPKTPVLSADQFKRTLDAMNIPLKTPVKAEFGEVVVNDIAATAEKSILGN